MSNDLQLEANISITEYLLNEIRQLPARASDRLEWIYHIWDTVLDLGQFNGMLSGYTVEARHFLPYVMATEIDPLLRSEFRQCVDKSSKI